ncbi:beta-ketoacyl-[acyl-carrier-protein] synthase family protein [Streptomyces sp. CB03238]|uniref:beta-ketoacyl-[acyl-carrier-protein] synthase family protein n=1 Tax=Streptomyces sp. CB03238 TaxID=1907777 RepID=UPI000A11E958|nr:beta-ketoacyl-[acyl-carrier-protein] synthase family protein [Streptomyces sp. CB03238]ORT59097.1 beta-ketoacyl-[acyl-carrier-protein] synthase II [Streptomyces sp. CB03238]
MSVAVTGAGAVTPIGTDAESFYRGLLAGRSGIRLLDGPGFEGLPTRLAGTADVEGRLDRMTARTIERVQQLALIAAREAWHQAKATDVAPERLAVVIGTAIGGVQAVPEQFRLVQEHGPQRISPYLMSQLMPNAAAAKVAMDLGARAGAHAPVSSCASGSEAMTMAMDLLRLNRADVVVAGGADSCLHPMTLAGFAQLRALSRRDDDPSAASRPFDRDRDGFVLGEGAGMLVLERAEHAEARGATVLGTLLGAGATSDAYHLMAPDPSGSGAARSIETALRDAGVTAADIGHVNSHGTATPAGDLAESRALNRALGSHRPAVTATKSCTGHLLGASGAVEAVATVLTLRDGLVPPIRNLERPGDGIDLDLVRTKPRALEHRVALSTSFGFGGHNTALVFAC